MKRINQKSLNETVASILRKRNYSNTSDPTTNRRYPRPRLNENKGLKNLEEEALKGMLNNSCSDSDVISLSQGSGDFAGLAEKSFKQFLEYVQQFKSKQRSFEQLLQLEFPLFVHIFIELFECGHRIAGKIAIDSVPYNSRQFSSIARRFYRDHKNRFKESSDQQIISAMESSITNSSLEPILKTFKGSKYPVKMSDKSLEQLKKYFESCNDLVIIQIIKTFIDFNIYSTHTPSDSEKKVDSTAKKLIQYNELDIIPPISSDTHSQDFETIELKKAIESLRNSDPCVPSLNKYTINCENLCSADILDDMSVIAFGLEDSTICLKRLCPNNGIKSDIEVKRKTSDISLNVIDQNMDDSCDESQTSIETLNSNCDMNYDSVNSSMMILRGHGGPVYDLKFVPKTCLLISCSYDTTVRVWDTTNGNNVLIYTNHLGPVFSLDTSLIDNLFVSGGKDCVAYLWSLERSFPLRSFCHSDSINCVRFHPNCNFVITSSADREIKVWDIHKSIAVRTLVSHNAPIYCMTISNCGHYLASAGEDRKIKIWDIMNAQVIKEFSGHTDAIFSLSFNHCNEILASCSADHTVRLWNCTQIASSDKTIACDSDSRNAQKTKKELLKSYRLESNVIFNRFLQKDLLVSISSKT